MGISLFLKHVLKILELIFVFVIFGIEMFDEFAGIF